MAEALALDEHFGWGSERRNEPAPELVPVEAPRRVHRPKPDAVSLSELVQSVVGVSDDHRSMTSEAHIQELARHDPSAAVARLLVDELTEETATRALRVLARTLAGQASDGVSFVVGTLRKRARSESFVKALSPRPSISCPSPRARRTQTSTGTSSTAASGAIEIGARSR